MLKESYPQGFYFDKELDAKAKRPEKWEELYRNIQLTLRSHPEYELEAVIDKYIKGWNENDRQDFRQWFRMKQDGGDRLYKRFSGEGQMKKYAVIDLGADETLKEMKKKLRSRIDSAERILQKMHDEGILGSGAETIKKVEYLSNIMQKLKNEILALRRPELVTARCNRVITMLRTAGIEESAEILEEGKAIFAGRHQMLIKTAASDISSILPQLEQIRDHLVKETGVLSFDRIKNLTKIIDFFDQHNLTYTDPLKKAINTLLKPLESASNDLFEVISMLSKVIEKHRVATQMAPKPQVPIQK